MSFSAKRIKTPSRGLLSMHPFVDVLEGRNLFTATAHDGLLDIGQLVDGPASDHAVSPWSNTTIGDAAGDDAIVDPAVALARQTTPHQFGLKPETSGAPFSDRTIGDSPWALFGNALHDRRGKFDPQPLPTDEQIAAARAADEGEPVFATGRTLSGAMAPFMTMAMTQGNHPFAG